MAEAVMLHWLTSKLRKDKAAHPLQTENGLQEVLNTLPPHLPIVLVGETAKWLAGADELRADLDPRQLLRAVRRLDEHAQAALAESWNAMLAQAAADGLDDSAWLALTQYHEHAAQAYRIAIDALAQPDKPAGADKNTCALLGTRAVAALVAKKRLLRLRYRYADAAYWQALHAMMAFGRSHAFAHLRVKPYAGADAASMLSEYLIGLVLEIAPLENLSPQQIACAELILRKHQQDILFRDGPGATVPYYIDLAGAAGPTRGAPEGDRPDTARFFGLGLIAVHVSNLHRDGQQRKAVPEWLSAAHCDLDEYLGLLRTLTGHWAGEPPQRKHPRRPAEAALHVVQGFSQIRRMVAASGFARSGRKVGYRSYLELMPRHEARFGRADEARTPGEGGSGKARAAGDEGATDEARAPMDVLQQLELAGDRQVMEDWTLLDLSETGLGAVVPHHKKWLRIGAIVGFRAHDSLDWRIGLVRRLGRTGQGRRLAGLQVLPGIPLVAEYRALDLEERGPWTHVLDAMGSGLRDAVLVSRILRTLVVERGAYREGRPLRLAVDGQPAHLRMSRLLERGADFEYVEYEDMPAPPDE